MEATILSAGMARHDGDWQNVRSPFARIYMVTEGSAQMVSKGKSCTLVPGHLYLIPPFTAHTCRCQDTLTLYYAHIHCPDGMPYADCCFSHEAKAGEHDEWLFRRLCEINAASTPSASIAVRMESSGIVNQLLARFVTRSIDSPSAGDTRIHRVRKYIQQNLDKNITIDSLAEMTYLSKDHLIRLFKSECGESPLQYINHCKMQLAETKLVTTSMPIKEIAYSLGFIDYSYFIRLFRQTTGATPSYYRKTAAK